MLSDEQITKYQTLYKNRYGKDISREEARTHGLRLIRFMQLIYSPLTAKEQQKLRERYPKITNYQSINKIKSNEINSTAV